MQGTHLEHHVFTVDEEGRPDKGKGGDGDDGDDEETEETEQEGICVGVEALRKEGNEENCDDEREEEEAKARHLAQNRGRAA